VEAHLFDFAKTCTSRDEVEFVANVRDEARFATLEALTGRCARCSERAASQWLNE